MLTYISTGGRQFNWSFNIFIKIMSGLLYNTYRYLIDPFAGGPCLRIQQIKMSIGFNNNIKNSSKLLIKQCFIDSEMAENSQDISLARISLSFIVSNTENSSVMMGNF